MIGEIYHTQLSMYRPVLTIAVTGDVTKCVTGQKMANLPKTVIKHKSNLNIKLVKGNM